MKPSPPWIRIVILGPDDDNCWHVYAQLRDADADRAEAATQTKLGTVSPEHIGYLRSHVERLARPLVGFDYSLSRPEHWAAHPTLEVDAVISGFDNYSETDAGDDPP